MSAFDKVIGYEPIKEELIQICDMIHNREHTRGWVQECLRVSFSTGHRA